MSFILELAQYSNTGHGAADASLYTASGINKRRAARAEQSYGNIPTISEEQRQVQSYYKGLKGLSAQDREAWELKYLSYIEGKSEEDKDDLFRSFIFKRMLKNSEDPEDLEMLERLNSNLVTRAERDRYFSKKTMTEDLDGQSDFVDERRSWRDRLDLSAYYLENEISSEDLLNPYATNSIREEAIKFLHDEGSELTKQEFNILKQDNTGAAQVMQEEFNESLREMFPYFKEYEGKLDLSDDDYTLLLARYRADIKLGGLDYALRNLNRQITDLIGLSLTAIEKLGNTTALFIDSGAGMIIRAFGMGLGLFGYGDEEDSWGNNVIDNPITRYGDRLATTHSWKKSEQVYLEEMGLSDNPILGTYDLLKALLSWNTPFELIGQYGFTTASTILTLGGTGIVNLGFKGIGAIHKASMAGKALNTTNKGVQFLRKLSKVKDISNTAIAGAVGTIEGGMNAALTYNITKKNLDNQANSYKYSKAAELYGANLFNLVLLGKFSDLEIILSLYRLGILNNEATSEDVARALYEYKNNPAFTQEIAKYLFSNQNFLAEADYWIKLNAPLLEEEYNSIMELNKTAAERAMYTDFTINSFINGMMRVTLLAGLNAAPVRNSINRTFGKKPKYGDKVQINKGADGKWVATPKKRTKMLEFWERSKASFGEGIEEGTQEISSKFGLDLANSRMLQYYNYLAGEGTEAFIEDLSTTIQLGLSNLGEHITSRETIKSFLYGGLSTMLGGFNINNSFNRGERLEGETKYQYIKRNSPIIWQSAFGAFMPGATDAENKQREKIAEKLNGFFADPEIQLLFSHAGQATDIMKTLDKALRKGNELEVRDARAELLIQAIQLLLDTEGSTYYDVVQEAIKQRINFKEENLQDPNSAESKAVAEYRQTIGNVKLSEEQTDIQILNRIKKQANKFNDFLLKVLNYTNDYRTIIGENADIDAVNSLVFLQIMLDNAESRAKKMDESINIGEQELRNYLQKHGRTLSNSILQSVKDIIVNFGSIQEANKNKEYLQEQILKIENSIREYKLAIKKIKSEKAKKTYIDSIKDSTEQLNTLKLILEPTSELISKFEKDITQDEEKRDILSLEDIMSLSAIEKSKLLIGYEDGSLKLSEENKKVIEKYKERMTVRGVNRYQEVIDRGIVLARSEQSAQEIYRALTSPKEFTNYARKQKTKARARVLEGLYEYLSTIQDYDLFVLDLKNIHKKGDPLEEQVANMQASKNKEFYGRYIKQVVDKLKKEKQYLKDVKLVGINEESTKIFKDVLNILLDANVDVENSNAVSLYIEENYEEILKTTSNMKDVSDTKENLTTFFNDTMSKLLEARAREQRLLSPGTIDDVVDNEETDSYEKASIKKIEVAKNKLSNLNLIYINTLTLILDTFNLTAENWEKVANIIINTVQSGAANPKAMKINILNNLKNSNIIANKEFAPNTILDTWCKEASINAVREAMRNTKDPKRSKSNKDYDKAIHSIGFIKDNGPDSLYITLFNYQLKYGMSDFLLSLSEEDVLNATVYFIFDPLLNDDIKSSMGTSSFDSNSTAVVAVVESEQSSTTIEINGKYYLPVAIMPSTYSESSTGSSNMAAIRQNIDVNKNYDSPFILTDSKGDAFQSNFINVSYALIQQVSNDLVALAAKKENLSLQEALETDNWEHFRATEWFKKARENFINSILFINQSARYIVHTAAGPFNVFLNTKPVVTTKSTNITGRPTLIDVFSSKDIDNILNFNPILGNATKALRTLALKLKDVTTDEDAALAIKNALEGIYYKGKIEVERAESNDAIFNIGLSYTNEEGNPVYVSLTTGQISNNKYSLTDEAIAQLFTNLIFKSGELGPIINLEGARKGVHWQVSKDWVENKIYDRLKTAYDSDIFEITADSLSPTPNVVTFTNPTKTKRTINTPVKASTNTASPTTPLLEEKQPAEEVKVEDSSIREKVDQALKTLKEKHRLIVEDRKRKGLESTTEQKVAVTALSSDLDFTVEDFIASDVIKENDPEKMAYPIGNIIDAFARDLFDNKIQTDSRGNYIYVHNDGRLFALTDVYPNIRLGHLLTMARQILDYKQYAENVLGYTFLSLEYYVEGKLDVTTSNNTRGTITYQGIPDIIAYDRLGNFHVIDIKTMRLPKTRASEKAWNKCKAYTPLIVLYAQALEQSLGVKVASVAILPILVNYTEQDVKSSMVLSESYNEDTHPKKGNKPKVAEIYVKNINGRHTVYTGTNPSAISNGKSKKADRIIFEVDRVELNKLKNKLSSEVQSAIVGEVSQDKEDPNKYTIEEEKQEESIIDISMNTEGFDDFTLDSDWTSSSSTASSLKSPIITELGLLYSELSESVKDATTEKEWNDMPGEVRKNFKECN